MAGGGGGEHCKALQAAKSKDMQQVCDIAGNVQTLKGCKPEMNWNMTQP